MRRTTKISIKAAREKQIEEDATRAFAEHEIRSRSRDRILIQRRYRDEKGGWDSTFAVEIVLLRGGLLVYGDIAHVLFGYHNAESIEGALAWLGDGLGSGYVAEKAAIGMRPPNARRIDHVRLTYAHAALLKARALVLAADAPGPEVKSEPDSETRH